MAAILELVQRSQETATTSDLASVWMRRNSELERELLDRRKLAASLERISSIAREAQVDVIMGVSPLGRWLSQGVAEATGVPLWDGASAAGSLLLVDGMVNTGIQLVLGRRQASESGVAQVTALAVRIDRQAQEYLLESGVRLVALEVI